MKEHNVYFASCVENGGIYHYKMTGNGKLIFVEKTSCDRPMYMIYIKKRLHVVLRAPFEYDEFSGILTYEIGDDGRLGNHSEVISSQGRCGCHLCELDGNIYVANYLSGSVFSSEGVLKVHHGKGINPGRQETPHTHYIAPSPDGKYLFVTDLGLDEIFVYDKRFNLVSVAKVSLGSGPRHLACFDETHIICVNELDCTVTMLRYHDGSLMPVQTISVLKRRRVGTVVTSAAIKVYDKYVFVSNRGDNSISMIEVLDGKLSLKSVTPCGGISPRDFMIADGLILCANQGSSTVTVLRIDKDSLKLLPTRTIENIEEVLCVCGDGT